MPDAHRSPTSPHRGRRTDAPLLWMRYVLDPALPERRVAFAIGRRLGTAVARNRLRRRLRALLAGRAGELPAGLYLVGARPAAVSAGFARLAADLDTLLARLLVRG